MTCFFCFSFQIQSLTDELSDDYWDAPGSEESTLFNDGSSVIGTPATRISLLSSCPSLPKEQILAIIPPRKVVDRHVSHFFNTFHFASCESRHQYLILDRGLLCANDTSRASHSPQGQIPRRGQDIFRLQLLLLLSLDVVLKLLGETFGYPHYVVGTLIQCYEYFRTT
jgi:hypothetical protein